jgi:hypothetical protein
MYPIIYSWLSKVKGLTLTIATETGEDLITESELLELAKTCDWAELMIIQILPKNHLSIMKV